MWFCFHHQVQANLDGDDGAKHKELVGSLSVGLLFANIIFGRTRNTDLLLLLFREVEETGRRNQSADWDAKVAAGPDEQDEGDRGSDEGGKGATVSGDTEVEDPGGWPAGWASWFQQQGDQSADGGEFVGKCLFLLLLLALLHFPKFLSHNKLGSDILFIKNSCKIDYSDVQEFSPSLKSDGKVLRRQITHFWDGLFFARHNRLKWLKEILNYI